MASPAKKTPDKPAPRFGKGQPANYCGKPGRSGPAKGNTNAIRHGLLAAHWLRHEIDKLSAADRLKFSEAIAKASDNRDKQIRLLGLDVKAKVIDLADYIGGNGDDQ